MNLLITKRPCLIGVSINSRREKHGEELKTAMDVPISGIMLTAAELATITGDEYIHAALFNEKGSLVEPNLQCFEPPFELKGKFEAPIVSIELGLKSELVTFEQVKLKSVRLTPMTGGLTEMGVLLQFIPELDHGITTLLAFIGKDGHIEINIGSVEEAQKARQGELPMSVEGGESPAPAKAERKRRQKADAPADPAVH